MSLYAYAPLIITGILVLIGLSISLYIIIQSKKMRQLDIDFMRQLEKSGGITDEQYLKEQEALRNKGIVNRWNNHWKKVFIDSDWINDKDVKPEQLGSLVFFGALGVYVIASILLANFGIGIIFALGGLVLVTLMGNAKIKRKQQIFEEQIPAFLSTLKANIQANQTPELALINAIENTNDPLYSELVVAKTMSETGSFKAAIIKLKKQTTNSTLKFLCSCIELASADGSNLENPIQEIEQMLERRRGLKRKLNVAIQENRPLLLVSAGMIPGLFIFLYLVNPMSREFWFKSGFSWIMFALVFVIFGIGTAAANHFIKKTSNF